MKKLALKKLSFSASNMVSADEKMKLLGGGDTPLCRCENGTSTPPVNGKCPCWCIPCQLPWP